MVSCCALKTGTSGSPVTSVNSSGFSGSGKARVQLRCWPYLRKRCWPDCRQLFRRFPKADEEEVRGEVDGVAGGMAAEAVGSSDLIPLPQQIAAWYNSIIKQRWCSAMKQETFTDIEYSYREAHREEINRKQRERDAAKRAAKLAAKTQPAT